jgi:RNA polymerase sigma factor (TIGR02999 family)
MPPLSTENRDERDRSLLERGRFRNLLISGSFYSVNELTQFLAAIEQGDPSAAGQLLPLVYGELRKLAEQRMRAESSDHTLQPTALVHEAYIRLVGETDSHWQGRGHFFAAAAIAMRRILVDHARAKQADKRGGDWQRVTLEAVENAQFTSPDDLLLLDETLQELSKQDPVCGKLVELRYFAGLSVEEAAAAIDISTATAYRHWSFAKAWLHARISHGRPASKK